MYSYNKTGRTIAGAGVGVADTAFAPAIVPDLADSESPQLQRWRCSSRQGTKQSDTDAKTHKLMQNTAT